MTAEVFDAHLGAFKEQQATPWGRLRYSLVRAYLTPHLQALGAAGLRVLDAGGGNGVEALALAGLGYHVTLVDYSAEMLREARAAAEAAGLAGRLAFHQADIEALPALFAPGAFDAALCHNVLQYVPDVSAALAALAGAVRPGGLLSIVAVNRLSEPLRLALQRLEPGPARASVGAPRLMTTIFHVESRALAAADLEAPLRAAGFAVVGHYGVRCVCDYMPDNERKSDPAFFADLEALERELGPRDPYRQIARYFHLVAVRDGAGGSKVH